MQQMQQLLIQNETHDLQPMRHGAFSCFAWASALLFLYNVKISVRSVLFCTTWGRVAKNCRPRRCGGALGG